MEMCYDGALVMPSNYAVMNEDEMIYVEGGFYISNNTLTDGLAVFVTAASLNFVMTCGVVSVIANTIKSIAGATLRFVGSIFAGFAGGMVGWVIGNFSGYAIGVQMARAVISGKGLNISWDGLTVE